MSDAATIAEPAAAIAPADDPANRQQVTLLPAGHRRAEAGRPWIYSNELAMDAAAKALPAGSLVTLRRADQRPLGVAMFNPHTLLAARLLDRDAARPIGRRRAPPAFPPAISSARCSCASGSTTGPITGWSTPRRTACPGLSSTASARSSRCRPTPPAWTA